jgi:hypothetical protein
LSRGEGEERKGEKGRLTGGTQPSVKEKEKKTGEAAWAGAGRVWWAAGPPGPNGWPALIFVFFLFLFQTSFSNHFSSKFKSNFFKLFSRIL